MRIIHSLTQLQTALGAWRRRGKKIGFVPTMGYLHAGHLALVRRSRKDCAVTVVSIYVNPKQFGPREDLRKYPRDIRRDAALLQKENVDILFIPSDNVVYPKGYLTYIDVENFSAALCGRFRPGHFRGVATIVAKLLNIIRPQRMYLGQKDAQQAVVLKTMVKDLNIPVSIEVVPTLREKDGLAMSSRNIFLTPRERCQAPVLYQALQKAVSRIRQGERRASVITGIIHHLIKRDSQGKIQYVACVDAETLRPLKTLEGKILIAVAVFFGKTRLIDNVNVRVQKPRQI